MAVKHFDHLSIKTVSLRIDVEKQSKYRILGIDPGTNYMGYGVLEVEGRTLRSVVLGAIDLHKMTDPYAKLRYIFERVGALRR